MSETPHVIGLTPAGRHVPPDELTLYRDVCQPQFGGIRDDIKAGFARMIALLEQQNSRVDKLEITTAVGSEAARSMILRLEFLGARVAMLERLLIGGVVLVVGAVITAMLRGVTLG